MANRHVGTKPNKPTIVATTTTQIGTNQYLDHKHHNPNPPISNTTIGTQTHQSPPRSPPQTLISHRERERERERFIYLFFIIIIFFKYNNLDVACFLF